MRKQQFQKKTQHKVHDTIRVKPMVSVLPNRSPEAMVAANWRSQLAQEFGIVGTIGSAVPKGWQFIVRTLLQELASTGNWNRQLLEIRDYMGILRIRLNPNATPEQQLACHRASQWSTRTCARCGFNHHHFVGLHARGHRMETTCEACHTTLTQEDPDGQQSCG